jgi:hypothetical protein
MVKKNIELFVKWYISNREGKGVNYLANTYKNNTAIFIEKLNEIGIEFEKSYFINPFEVDLNNISIDSLDLISVKLKERSIEFENYNKKNSNGIPRAILGAKNYLRFLNEIVFRKEELFSPHTKFPYKRDFIQYLQEEENYTTGSSNSYASYVASANKTILKGRFERDFFEIVNECVNKFDDCGIEDLLDLAISIVLKEGDDKNKSKYKSGLLEYKYFLMFSIKNGSLPENIEVLENQNQVETDSEMHFKIKKIEEEGKVDNLVYDKETLADNFTFRMISQDRLYGDVYFPIRFLKKIFYRDKDTKNYFKTMIISQIEDIRMYIDEFEFIAFKEIDTLEIDTEGNVFLTHNNIRSRLFTEDGYSGLKIPLTSFSLRNIVIDHVKPMKEILTENITNLSALLEITNKFKSHGGLKGSGKELQKSFNTVGNQFIDDEIFSLEEVYRIKYDLDFIDNHIKLQLMDWKENLRKNKK